MWTTSCGQSCSCSGRSSGGREAASGNVCRAAAAVVSFHVQYAQADNARECHDLSVTETLTPLPSCIPQTPAAAQPTVGATSNGPFGNNT